METLEQTLATSGRTVQAVAEWLGAYLGQCSEESWRQQLPDLRLVYERAGEPAYGVYVRDLFRPAEAELRSAGLACRPRLPGTLAGSEERWGPPRERERRMWSVVGEADGRELGTIVTRFFHDHTRLRLPRPPAVIALEQTADEEIRQAVLTEL
jgi:hypothetical protein